MTNIKNGDTATHSGDKWDPEGLARESKGVGFTEAPRGALAHWVKIKDTKIENYQCVVPTTWNGSPRDEAGNIGAFEAALMNTKVERPNEPVEILRSLHSFDPCLACSTHVMSEDGEELAKVTTTPVGAIGDKPMIKRKANTGCNLAARRRCQPAFAHHGEERESLAGQASLTSSRSVSSRPELARRGGHRRPGRALYRRSVIGRTREHQGCRGNQRQAQPAIYVYEAPLQDLALGQRAQHRRPDASPATSSRTRCRRCPARPATTS